MPLALPAIVAGVRLATVTTIGLVTVASLVGSKNLGWLMLFPGFQQGRRTPILVGAVLAVALAVVAEGLFLGVELALSPWRRAQRRRADGPTRARRRSGLPRSTPPPPPTRLEEANTVRGLSVSIVADVVAWFGDGENWTGSSGVLARLREHIVLSAAATGRGLPAHLPAGQWLGHRRRGGFVVVNLANLGRAIPSLAILLLAVQWLGLRGVAGGRVGRRLPHADRAGPGPHRHQHLRRHARRARRGAGVGRGHGPAGQAAGPAGSSFPWRRPW